MWNTCTVLLVVIIVKTINFVLFLLVDYICWKGTFDSSNSETLKDDFRNQIQTRVNMVFCRFHNETGKEGKWRQGKEKEKAAKSQGKMFLAFCDLLRTAFIMIINGYN